MTGGAVEVNNAGIGYDFIDNVSKVLLPDRVAVIAEIEEDWTTPVDTRMEALSGTVFRRALSEVKEQIQEENVAAMKADLAQLKAEHAKADRKAKLQEKINQLNSKIQAQLQNAKDRREALQRKAQAKVQVLKDKATEARARAS